MKRIWIFWIVILLLGTESVQAQNSGKIKLGTQSPLDSKRQINSSPSQADSNHSAATVKVDSLLPHVDNTIHSAFITPKKKAMYSAIVPGLGQIYNKQYWKLPIVYGALGFGAFQIYYKNDKFNYYRRIYAGRLGSKQEFINMEATVSDEGIKYYMDAYRQERDLAALLTALGYGLQIMDALVFAHLKGFDITEDISMKFKPTLLPNNYYAPSPIMGLSMVIQWR